MYISWRSHQKVGGDAGATGSEAVERATEVLNCVSASFNQKLLDIFNEGPQR